jgi:hypothetical protein
MMRLRIGFFLVLLAIGQQLTAQTNMLGLTNIPSNKQQNWKNVSTDFFDVHYGTDDPIMAGVAGKMAEEALWDICKAFDYKNRSRFAFYLYLSPNDLIHSNTYPVRNEKDNGLTPLRINSANLLFPGNYEAFREHIRAEVTRLVMEDYYFGGPIQLSIQNTVLLYLPDWYAEGLPAYLGEGWDYEDELWLASLGKTDMLNFAIEGKGPIFHTARKSIWYFIAQNYGPEKLGEIFYMTRLTRSVEDGVIHVLGITLKTLTEKWREFVLQHISDNENFREPIDEQSVLAELAPADKVVSFALHPNKAKAAIYLNNGGKQRVVIYNFETGKIKSTPIEGGFTTEQFDQFRFEMPMAWSPDGNQLVTTIFDKGNEFLAWYDVSKGSVKFVAYRPSLDRIYQIAWSPDGTQLVCSGLKQGQIDLYRFVPGAGSFVPLTNDFFDDLYPVWSDDGGRIYHASTRQQATLPPGNGVRYDANEIGLDIWAYDFAEGSLSRVTRSPDFNEVPVGMASSFELLVQSDQTGLHNLQKINVFVGDSSYQTNMSPGMYRAAVNDSLLAYSTSAKGELMVFVAPREEVVSDQVATRTMLRQRNDKAASIQRLKLLNAAKADSIRKAGTALPELKTPEVKDDKTPADSAKTNDKTVKYYVFDDDDGDDKEKPRKRPKKNSGEYLLKKEPERPNFDAVVVKSPTYSRNTWSADRVTTRFGFDPVFKLSFLAEARLRDQQGNHQLTMGFKSYLDLRSSDTYIRYANLKHSLDYQVGFTRSGRFLNKAGLAARYNWTRLDGSVVLPLNRFLSVGVGAHAALIDRKNIALLIPKTIDGQALMAGGRVNVTYDKTVFEGNFVRKGTFATVDVTNAYSFSNSDDNFVTARMDLRKYIPVKRSVLAGRISGAWSEGGMQQQFFLGGAPEALLARFQNPADFPIESANLPALHYMEYITPIRGFQFNGRNGTKYVAANAELRIPLSRIMLNSLNTNPAYNIELIPFFDIGTTWTQGNPLSQKNPIDTEVINSYPLTITVQTLKSPFLMGFGAGTRLQMFGYSMRADLAWGVEDFTILSPRLHLSLGKNF